MPRPTKGQTQDEFISEYVSSSEAIKKYPDKSQRLAIAYSLWRQHKKECYVKPYEVKESDNGDIVVKGYIATTHLDSGFLDETRQVYVRDRISKEALERWAEDINSGNPRANKVSVNHKREPHVAGVGLKGSAHVDKLPDGQYGLWVETLVDRTRPDFEEIKYRIDKGLLDSYSIEFSTKDSSTGRYMEGAVRENSIGDGIIRTLLPGTQLEGWTLASQPMNEYAIMIKEFIVNHKEEPKVNEIEEKKKKAAEEEEDETPDEVAKKGAKPAKANNTDLYGNPVAVGPTARKAGKEISDEDYNLLIEKKKKKELEAKEAMIRDAVKKELKEIKIENKVAHDNPEAPMETKESKMFREALTSKTDLSAQFKMAARFCEAKGMIDSFGVKPSSRESLGKKYFSTNGSKLEFKGLGVTTNQNSDTDYLLSAAELADSFDPVIYNALNQQTVTWNILNKDDYSNKGNNQVQFVLKTVANASTAAYTGNAVSTGQVTRLKLETKFKKYQVGVEVDGDMIAAARGGPIGDVFAQEVMDSTIDLLSFMNKDLFGTSGAETDAKVIGFKYIADSGSYTTLYNLTRSSTNKLSPDSAANTYINQASARISLTNLRKAYENAVVDGSMLQNLVFVTHPTQVNLFRGIYDAAQRPVPTSSRFGFEGRPEIDGIPIFADKDCANSDWYLLDLDSHRVAIWVPPTLEMLGKDADSQKGFIKAYWCTYYRNPRRLVNIYGCATS